MEVLNSVAHSAARVIWETAHNDPAMFCMLVFGAFCVLWLPLYMYKNRHTGFSRPHF